MLQDVFKDQFIITQSKLDKNLYKNHYIILWSDFVMISAQLEWRYSFQAENPTFSYKFDDSEKYMLISYETCILQISRLELSFATAVTGNRSKSFASTGRSYSKWS